MNRSSGSVSLDGLLAEVFSSTPLLFVREFLRTHKQRAKGVRIGVTLDEVRANLRDAIVSKMIGREEVEEWLQAIEGWGKQHLYLSQVPKRALTQAHLLNTDRLRTFLTKRDLLKVKSDDTEPSSEHLLQTVLVDDERATLSWRSHGIDHERREELDEVRELEDGEYEFRAYRRAPRRSASRFIVRKVSGTVLTLIDMPLGDEHTALRAKIDTAAKIVLSPLSIDPIPLAPIISALDAGAVARHGPKAKRALSLGVAPTQARYRTDGAEVEFRSTKASSGYTDSDPVRRVRQALRIESFVGSAGKFRLTFFGEHRQAHTMTVSLHATENRIFLFSRMNETEVLALVDQLLALEV